MDVYNLNPYLRDGVAKRPTPKHMTVAEYGRVFMSIVQQSKRGQPLLSRDVAFLLGLNTRSFLICNNSDELVTYLRNEKVKVYNRVNLYTLDHVQRIVHDRVANPSYPKHRHRKNIYTGKPRNDARTLKAIQPALDILFG
jgi:hypothetical protein